jgi:hypothetical protein
VKIKLTDAQWTALRWLSTSGALCPHRAMCRGPCKAYAALERKGLVREISTPGRWEWELTDAGRAARCEDGEQHDRS